jgi:hypothetical protein
MKLAGFKTYTYGLRFWTRVMLVGWRNSSILNTSRNGYHSVAGQHDTLPEFYFPLVISYCRIQFANIFLKVRVAWRKVVKMTRPDEQPVRSAYQPPANSTFLSERTSHQQPAATSQQYCSLRTNQHQPSATSQPNRLETQSNRWIKVSTCHIFSHNTRPNMCFLFS